MERLARDLMNLGSGLISVLEINWDFLFVRFICLLHMVLGFLVLAVREKSSNLPSY